MTAPPPHTQWQGLVLHCFCKINGLRVVYTILLTECTNAGTSPEHHAQLNGAQNPHRWFLQKHRKKLSSLIQEPHGVSRGAQRLFVGRTKVSPLLYLGTSYQLYCHINEKLPSSPKKQITANPLLETSTCFPKNCTALYCSRKRILVILALLPYFRRTKPETKNAPDSSYVNEKR